MPGLSAKRRLAEGIARAARRRRRAAQAFAGFVLIGVALLTTKIVAEFPGGSRQVEPSHSAKSSIPAPSADAGGGIITQRDLRTFIDGGGFGPLILPASMPAGYQWLGPQSFASGGSADDSSLSSLFAATPLSAGPRVEVCAAMSEKNVCNSGAANIRRQDGPVVVVISFSDGPSTSELAFWRNVPLVQSEKVAWLAGGRLTRPHEHHDPS